MLIRVGYEMSFEAEAELPMTMLLYVLPSRIPDLRQPDKLTLFPAVPMTEFLDCFGNRCVRILAPAGELRVCNDSVVEDSGVPEPIFADAVQHPIEELPTEVLQFLLPSRYCESDSLSDEAWKLFGDLPPGWGRAQAICDWVHNNIEFGYKYANPTKTAADVLRDRQGVCRDFTHLAVTFCRAMNLPTRYATGYLGDIGVPVGDTAMDFSACFQVYLGGRWHTFDARHNIRRIGWILIATGRDAVDCAMTTSYGQHLLKKFVVWTDEVQTADISDRRF